MLSYEQHLFWEFEKYLGKQGGQILGLSLKTPHGLPPSHVSHLNPKLTALLSGLRMGQAEVI